MRKFKFKIKHMTSPAEKSQLVYFKRNGHPSTEWELTSMCD